MLRSRNTPHISGRASDLESQPMSVIEEEDVQNTELYNTQEFPLSGSAPQGSDAQPANQPAFAMPAPPARPYLNDDDGDEALREDIRKALLKRASPVINMARQIAGAANLELHRVIRQEVDEQLIEKVFNQIQPKVKEEKAKQRALQWLEEAQKVNSEYLPMYNIVKLYKLNVFLKIQAPFFYIGTKDDGTLTLEKYTLDLTGKDAKQQVLQIMYCLQQENVYGTSLGYDMKSTDDVMHNQKAAFDKFNIYELRDIVNQFENNALKSIPTKQKIDEETPIREVRTVENSESKSEEGSKDTVKEPPSLTGFKYSGVDVNNMILTFAPPGDEDIAEWEPRIETHVLETCQIVYDTLKERGERISSVDVVKRQMIETNDGADLGSRLLFARVCANRINFSNEMAPRQHYLQARYGRLRQQFALLLVNMRRLHFKDNKFMLDTAIPRRGVRIY